MVTQGPWPPGVPAAGMTQALAWAGAGRGAGGLARLRRPSSCSCSCSCRQRQLRVRQRCNASRGCGRHRPWCLAHPCVLQLGQSLCRADKAGREEALHVPRGAAVAPPRITKHGAGELKLTAQSFKRSKLQCRTRVVLFCVLSHEYFVIKTRPPLCFTRNPEPHNHSPRRASTTTSSPHRKVSCSCCGRGR